MTAELQLVEVVEVVDAECNPETVHYSDIVIHLPAICEECHCEIVGSIHVRDGHLYCYEHVPLGMPDWIKQ